MAKIPKKLIPVLNDLQESIQRVSLTKARIEVGCANLPEHFKEKPAEYYEGLIKGYCAAIESILFNYNAYKGFSGAADYSDLYKVDYSYPIYIIY